MRTAVVRQAGQVTDVRTLTVKVAPEVPGIWRQVVADDFESGTPAALTVTGPSGGVAVHRHPAGGQLLVVRRATTGATEIGGTRAFRALSGDVKLSAEVRADQVARGLGLRLVDGAGDPVVACAPAVSGQWACTDGSAARSTHFAAYAPGTWQQLDVVLRAATGRVETFLDGTKQGDVARVSADPPSELVVRIPAENAGTSSYALDDRAVAGG